MVAWRSDLRFAYSSVCLESASAGFVRYAKMEFSLCIYLIIYDLITLQYCDLQCQYHCIYDSVTILYTMIQGDSQVKRMACKYSVTGLVAIYN